MRFKQIGAAAIEFALVLPLYLIVIDGVMELSILSYDQMIVLNAAREATRAGIILREPKMNTQAIAQVAQNYAEGYLLSLKGDEYLTVNVNQSLDGSYQTPLSVTVEFTYNSLLAGNFMSAIKNPIFLTSTATLMNE